MRNDAVSSTGRGRHLRKAGREALELKVGAKVEETVLRNGMRLIVAERRSDPVVASVLFYSVGARNETEREAGVSHFLEHMMFKGSRSFGKGEVDRVTTELGGQNNAYTGYDHTAYWFEFASDRWERALDIEVDRMTHLLLEEREFEAERDVVLEELAMGEDDPWRLLTEHIERSVFPRHPYGRPIIGYSESLQRMTPDVMRAYYRRFYHPANATLVIAGDVSRAKAVREVRTRFAALPAGPSREESDCFRPVLREPAGPVHVETAWDDEAKRFMVAWPTVPVATPADYALDLALVILTGGRMSRLQRRLVFDSGLATSVSASNDTRVESGAFWLFVECARDASEAELERALDEEIERLASRKVGAAELARAKSVMRSSEAFDGEAVSDLAEELGELAVDADWRIAFDGKVRHDRVDAGDVRRAVATYLAPRRRVSGWSLPRSIRVVAPPSRVGKRGKKAAKRR